MNPTDRLEGQAPDAPKASAPDPLIGLTVMGYTVQRIVGEGAMGAVYAGEHRLGGIAAIKLLHPRVHSDRELREAFEAETRILFKLDNTHLVKAFGYEALPDGRFCLLMAYHENTALDRVLDANGGSLPIATALAYGWQILDGLEAAHGAGVWHRDLKPSNILELKESTQVDGVSYPLLKIVDFGLAHDSAPRRLNTPEPMPAIELPAPQIRAGTPIYLSPEQAAGRPTDARSDLYAFGVMLFEMVSGRLPFEGEGLDVIRKHRHERPPHLKQHASYVPEALDALVDQLLEKDPARRPQSATDVKRELARVLKQLHGERTFMTPAPSAPATASSKSALTARVEPPARLNPWKAAIVALSLLAAVSLAIVLAPSRTHAPAPPPPVEPSAPMPTEPAPRPVPPPAPPVPPVGVPAEEPARSDDSVDLAPLPKIRPEAKAAAARFPACAADAAWKAARERDLQDLTKLAAQNGWLDEFEKVEAELTPLVTKATPQTCGRVGAKIDALSQRYRRPR